SEKRRSLGAGSSAGLGLAPSALAAMPAAAPDRRPANRAPASQTPSGFAAMAAPSRASVSPTDSGSCRAIRSASGPRAWAALHPPLDPPLASTSGPGRSPLLLLLLVLGLVMASFHRRRPPHP